VKKAVRGAVKEGKDGGQNSGDTGGTHSVEQVKADAAALASSTTPQVSGLSPQVSPQPKVYTQAEKTACSIEAMKNGEICEACQ